jgi:hypothetical protein
MSENLFGSVSFALAGGMSLVVLAIGMAFLHARRASQWDTLAERVLAEARPAEARFTKAPARDGATRHGSVR